MVLRCTQELLALVGERDARAVELPPGDDDWYLHLLRVDRKKCLLAVTRERCSRRSRPPFR